ncbi:hypothetical protein [Rhizobium ruizarguesonis]
MTAIQLASQPARVITMRVLDDRTLFMDHSRGIAGEIQGTPEHLDAPSWLMLRYDRNADKTSVEAMALEIGSVVVKVRI